MAANEEESKSFGQKALGWPAQTKSYVEELQLEMKRVTWPSWKQVRATTMVVILAVFAFAGYFYVIDMLIGGAITKLFNSLTR